MAKYKPHLVHLNSVSPNKIILPEKIMYGELAINYNAGNEKLQLKNSDDKIITFSQTDEKIEDLELIIASAISKLDTEKANKTYVNGKVLDISNRIESVNKFINEYIEENEEITASALTKLDNEKANKKEIQAKLNNLQTQVDIIDEVKAGAIAELAYRLENTMVEVFMRGVNNVNTLYDIPTDKHKINATLSSDEDFKLGDLSEEFIKYGELLILVVNDSTNDITITIPNDYITFYGSNINIPSNGIAQLKVAKFEEKITIEINTL